MITIPNEVIVLGIAVAVFLLAATFAGRKGGKK
jgi:preprotein translocase subunit Sec61beta